MQPPDESWEINRYYHGRHQYESLSMFHRYGVNLTVTAVLTAVKKSSLVHEVSIVSANITQLQKWQDGTWVLAQVAQWDMSQDMLPWRRKMKENLPVLVQGCLSVYSAMAGLRVYLSSQKVAVHFSFVGDSTDAPGKHTSQQLAAQVQAVGTKMVQAIRPGTNPGPQFTKILAKALEVCLAQQTPEQGASDSILLNTMTNAKISEHDCRLQACCA